MFKLEDVPEDIRSHFIQTCDVLSGKLRGRGTRILVKQVLELLESGATPAEIIGSFPSLTELDLAAAERLAAHFALRMLMPA
jgi:uncharacterized protein (DUF433 family)